MRTRGIRPASAPADEGVAVCPHCWYVSPGGIRLCGRCGADMTTALQESGGLRATAPVQSPMPVRAQARLSPLQRWILLGFVVLLAAGYLVSAIKGPPPRPGVEAPAR